MGKASGHDEVVAEVLCRGGDSVLGAVHGLCQKMWREEKLPRDWTRGVICPLYKDGDKRDTSNYRGITLLSIVGKVYSQVLNSRIVKWAEENKVLTEEQGGFRPHRGCPDQIFSLVETIRSRGRKGTFCCFIDVKKAFDRVFRAGLWKRVAEEGVKGKMWRVLRSIYETVESCVRVSGKCTDWFPVNTGVRQGCILSPLLYALFINGLIKELKRLDIGVEIEEGGEKLNSLLYADDIVLLAQNRQDLQKLMNAVTDYARKWRFELNPKKSEVVVFGMKRAPRNIVWKLGEHVVKQVNQYKYLGMELTRTLNWNSYIKRIVSKAKRNMTQALGMGISGGFMTVRMACTVWKSLVRSVLEYGCEVWGDKRRDDIEELQVEMGKRILRCGSRMSAEVVRGELGWERMRARRDEMRLRYWGRVIRMGEERIVRQIYRASRNRMEREEREIERGGRESRTPTWCHYTRELLKKLKLEKEWDTEEIPPEEEWNALVRERIAEREQIKWRSQCLSKSKLRTYVKLKKVLRTEPFLRVYQRRGIPEIVKLRGGTNRLRIEKGRYKKEALEDRVCQQCDSKEVEDESHFMLKCRVYEDLRKKMWDRVEAETGRNEVSFKSDEKKMNALLGDKFQPDPDEKKDSTRTQVYQSVARTVMQFVMEAMDRRRKLQNG
jgi:hypothetical protein